MAFFFILALNFINGADYKVKFAGVFKLFYLLPADRSLNPSVVRMWIKLKRAEGLLVTPGPNLHKDQGSRIVTTLVTDVN